MGALTDEITFELRQRRKEQHLVELDAQRREDGTRKYTIGELAELAELAELFDVGRASVYRAVDRSKQAPKPPRHQPELHGCITFLGAGLHHLKGHRMALDPRIYADRGCSRWGNDTQGAMRLAHMPLS